MKRWGVLIALALAACGGESNDAAPVETTTTTEALDLATREAIDVCEALDEAVNTEGGLTASEALAFGEKLAVAEEVAAEPVATRAGALLESIESGGTDPDAGPAMRAACEDLQA